MPSPRITRVPIPFRLSVLGLLAVMPPGVPAAAAPAERIEGVIVERRDVAGKSYASISVGADDAVRRKMRLNVVSRKGELLGHLTVTVVEPEEAIGVLSGPRLKEIGPNDRVTQPPAGKDGEGREEFVKL